MTEEEAKTKWCPMVRAGHVAGMAVNVEPNGDFKYVTRCIASDCMMWKQYVVPTGKKDELLAGGYCGLAGK